MKTFKVHNINIVEGENNNVKCCLFAKFVSLIRDIILCTGLCGLITKNRVDESDRSFDVENESDRKISPARQIFE